MGIRKCYTVISELYQGLRKCYPGGSKRVLSWFQGVGSSYLSSLYGF